MVPLVRLLKLSGRPDSRDLMRGGVEVVGIGGSSVEDPVPEEPPLNLVLYMKLGIFTYSSNIFMTSLDPMDSMLAFGTCKNSRFSRRSSSLRERDPDMKMIFSTRQSWCCIVSPRALRRDVYWFSPRNEVLVCNVTYPFEF